MTAPTMSIIPTEPLFLGERFVRLLFYIAPRNPGDPQYIVGTITLMPGEENIVLDAIKGDKGDKGDPSPFWRPEWNSTITDPADLPGGLTGTGPGALTPADAGRAWYISGYWHIWTGEDWRVLLGSIIGPPGPTPNISVLARGVEAPAGPITYPLNLNVSEGGDDLAPIFTVDVPLLQGQTGPPGPLLDSPDIYGFPLEGQQLVYSSTAGGPDTVGVKWADPSPNAPKMFSIPESAFGPAATLAQAINPLATLIVPAQEQAYYPVFDGHLRWKRSGLFNTAQVEVEIRALPQGSTNAPETGTLCARALYDPSTLDYETIAHFREHWSDSANPSRAVSPDTNEARIPAGQAMVYHVLLRRVAGSGSITWNPAGAHAGAKLYPVS